MVMKILVAIATLFVIGSTLGYVIELLFRRFVSQTRWVNPGFMVGPYIPLYGFGTMILYGLSNVPLDQFGLPKWAVVLITLLAIGIALTLIELVAGSIFIKGLHMKLWDYSDRWGNFKGLICPLFSFIWFGVGVAYYFLLNPILVQALLFIAQYPIYVFFTGVVIGMIIVDFCYSLHLGLMIKRVSDKATVKFDELKEYLSDKFASEDKKKPFYALHFLSKDNIKEVIKDYYEKSKENALKLKNKILRKK